MTVSYRIIEIQQHLITTTTTTTAHQETLEAGCTDDEVERMEKDSCAELPCLHGLTCCAAIASTLTVASGVEMTTDWQNHRTTQHSRKASIESELWGSQRVSDTSCVVETFSGEVNCEPARIGQWPRLLDLVYSWSITSRRPACS